MKKIFFILTILLIFISSISFAGDVRCYNIFSGQSVSPGGYVESTNILLSERSYGGSGFLKVPSDGILSIQPHVTSGTFTFTVYFSNFRDASVWDSGTTIATGITSSDTDRISIDPDGVALWMKIRATETSGTGSPSLSVVLCSD